MKDVLPQPLPTVTAKPLLKNIISKLAVSFMPLTIERRSLIVNHISSDIALEKDENLVSLTLGSLLQNIILHTKEQCIQVHSDEDGSSTLITLNSTDPKLFDTLLVKSHSIQQQVSGLGGFINMSFDKAKGTTISFTVTQPLKAA